MHKEYSRGYNQSKLLAEAISNRLNLPITGLLAKVEVKSSQVQAKDKESRKKNIKGSFKIEKSVEAPPKAILIDDVITTGATVLEATKALKRAGVRKVVIVVLAMD
jgi:competence protein ComFC